MTRARAVVFGYHDVGVRCLKSLLSAGMDVPLVVTVADDPAEAQWFSSVAATASEYGIPVMVSSAANNPDIEPRIHGLEPDFIFSFYYRSLLNARLLANARRGALNIHGSLLPRYRGRAPVNWAILNGERETGATLHYMVDRADAGEIVDQLAVPILQDDDAREVYAKVTVAAETVLTRSLPGLIAGTAPRQVQPVLAGQYFGRRRPEDGRIDWTRPAQQIHNLVRAVAPPFPGAFTEIRGERWWIYRTRVAGGGGAAGGVEDGGVAADGIPVACMAGAGTEGTGRARLVSAGDRCQVECCDGSILWILAATRAAGPVELPRLAVELRDRPILLG